MLIFLDLSLPKDCFSDESDEESEDDESDDVEDELLDEEAALRFLFLSEIRFEMLSLFLL